MLIELMFSVDMSGMVYELGAELRQFLIFKLGVVQLVYSFGQLLLKTADLLFVRFQLSFVRLYL